MVEYYILLDIRFRLSSNPTDLTYGCSYRLNARSLSAIIGVNDVTNVISLEAQSIEQSITMGRLWARIPPRKVTDWRINSSLFNGSCLVMRLACQDRSDRIYPKHMLTLADPTAPYRTSSYLENIQIGHAKYLSVFQESI